MSALGGQRAYLMVLLDLSAAFTASENTMKIGCQGLLSGSKVILAIASKLYELVKNHRAFWYWSVCAPGLRIRACALHCVHILIGSTSFSFYMNYHFYADDSQLYLLFQPQDIAITVQRVEKCITSVRQWMCEKSLKINHSNPRCCS